MTYSCWPSSCPGPALPCPLPLTTSCAPLQLRLQLWLQLVLPCRRRCLLPLCWNFNKRMSIFAQHKAENTTWLQLPKHNIHLCIFTYTYIYIYIYPIYIYSWAKVEIVSPAVCFLAFLIASAAAVAAQAEIDDKPSPKFPRKSNNFFNY